MNKQFKKEIEYAVKLRLFELEYRTKDINEYEDAIKIIIEKLKKQIERIERIKEIKKLKGK